MRPLSDRDPMLNPDGDSELLLDRDYVAEILKRDARRRCERYSDEGAAALVVSERPRNAMRPNTQFLHHLVRAADSHNQALLQRESRQSQAKLRGLDEEKECGHTGRRERDCSKPNRLSRRDEDGDERTRKREREREQRRSSGDDRKRDAQKERRRGDGEREEGKMSSRGTGSSSNRHLHRSSTDRLRRDGHETDARPERRERRCERSQTTEKSGCRSNGRQDENDRRPDEDRARKRVRHHGRHDTHDARQHDYVQHEHDSPSPERGHCTSKRDKIRGRDSSVRSPSPSRRSLSPLSSRAPTVQVDRSRRPEKSTKREEETAVTDRRRKGEREKSEHYDCRGRARSRSRGGDESRKRERGTSRNRGRSRSQSVGQTRAQKKRRARSRSRSLSRSRKRERPEIEKPALAPSSEKKKSILDPCSSDDDMPGPAPPDARCSPSTSPASSASSPWGENSILYSSSTARARNLESRSASAKAHPDADPSRSPGPGPPLDVQAVAAYRARMAWKQAHVNRLRESGYSEAEIEAAAAESGPAGSNLGWMAGGGSVDDIRWTSAGQVRDWDRGKVLDEGGNVNFAPAWKE